MERCRPVPHGVVQVARQSFKKTRSHCQPSCSVEEATHVRRQCASYSVAKTLTPKSGRDREHQRDSYSNISYLRSPIMAKRWSFHRQQSLAWSRHRQRRYVPGHLLGRRLLEYRSLHVARFLARLAQVNGGSAVRQPQVYVHPTSDHHKITSA